MPIVNTNSTIHIGVELENGVIIHGQHEISHPTSASSLPSPRFHPNVLPPSPRLHRHHSHLNHYLQRLNHTSQHLFYSPHNSSSLIPHSNSPNSPSHHSHSHIIVPPSPTRRLNRSSSLPSNNLDPNGVPDTEQAAEKKTNGGHHNIVVEKNGNAHAPLEAKIKRLFYLNEDRQEILPPCNPTVLAKIQEQDTIVYSIGSLWTSIIPCLVLKGVGEAICNKKGHKVLILNGYPDRETHDHTAEDYVSAITAALNRFGVLRHSPHKYITHLVWVEGSKVPVNEDALRAQGIACVRIARSPACAEDAPVYDEALLVQCLADLAESENGHVLMEG